MANYNPIEFKSNFKQTRSQMINEFNYDDAAKSVQVMCELNRILNNAITVTDENKSPMLWRLYVDLKDELEKLNINCLFQSTFAAQKEIKVTTENNIAKMVSNMSTASTPEARLTEMKTENDSKAVSDYTPNVNPGEILFGETETPPVESSNILEEYLDTRDSIRDINLFNNVDLKDRELAKKENEEVKKTEILVPNAPEYKFLLKLDNVSKVLFVTKNLSKAKMIKISKNVIPITESTKNKFTKQRSGFNEPTPGSRYNFKASFISGEINEKKYNDWCEYVAEVYRVFANKNK